MPVDGDASPGVSVAPSTLNSDSSIPVSTGGVGGDVLPLPSSSTPTPSFVAPSFSDSTPLVAPTPPPTISAGAGPSITNVASMSLPHKHGNSGVIAGGVVGGVVGLALIILAVFLLRRQRLSKRSDDNYGKSQSELTYRTTDMSSDSSPGTYQTQHGQPPDTYEPVASRLARAGYGHPPVAQEQPNYAERHSTSREAAKVILSPTAIRPQRQATPPASPARNELDSREVNEDGVSVRSPSLDINADTRLDSIRGPTPTQESQAARGHVPRLPLFSRTKGGQEPTV